MVRKFAVNLGDPIEKMGLTPVTSPNSSWGDPANKGITSKMSDFAAEPVAI